MNKETPISPVSLLAPPHMIKQKAGSGGIDPKLVQKAQTTIDNADIDFSDIANPLLSQIDTALEQTKAGMLKRHESVEAIIYPAMQLKAHGTMFQYPLVTTLCNTLIDFLDTLTEINSIVVEIILSYQKTLKLILKQKMKGDGGKDGKALRDALEEVCERYSKTHS